LENKENDKNVKNVIKIKNVKNAFYIYALCLQLTTAFRRSMSQSSCFSDYDECLHRARDNAGASVSVVRRARVQMSSFPVTSPSGGRGYLDGDVDAVVSVFERSADSRRRRPRVSGTDITIATIGLPVTKLRPRGAQTCA